jgi:hypothetical protein
LHIDQNTHHSYHAIVRKFGIVAELMDYEFDNRVIISSLKYPRIPKC